MQEPSLYVANWKMALTHEKAVELAQQIGEFFPSIPAQDKKIVLCPSYTDLKSVHAALKKMQNPANSTVSIGAQNCSHHKIGAYTGEISAHTLKEIGCSYCIVGHSERRIYHHETDLEIAAKIERLLEQHICPILCVGETKVEYEKRQTENVLQKQLDLALTVLYQFNAQKPSFIIAYEPVWAIGTGTIPEIGYLNTIFSILDGIRKEYSFDSDIKLLYGGSISEKNSESLKKISCLNGFLIGGASLDFQKFKNIVS